jgi:probable HAF family extracellular repeat protein
MQKKIYLAVFLSLVAPFCLIAGLGASQYVYQNLGTLPDGGSSAARAINEVGQVAGYATTYLNAFHVVLWSPANTLQDLGTLGGNLGFGYGINDAGQVVGESRPPATLDVLAFRWSPEIPMESLGTLGGNNSYARAINNAGQIVGYSNINPQDYHAFLWTQETGMQDLQTLGGKYSTANSVNASGQVVGNSYIDVSTSTAHAFIWTSVTGMRDLGSTLGGANANAMAINNLGQVAGYSSTQSGVNHAFLWSPSMEKMQDLGTLGGDSYAEGINDAGQVVGYSYLQPVGQSAFLWSLQNGMQDLNDLVVNLPAGVKLAAAYDINERGHIVGITSTNRAFRLTPASPTPHIPLLLLD